MTSPRPLSYALLAGALALSPAARADDAAAPAPAAAAPAVQSAAPAAAAAPGAEAKAEKKKKKKHGSIDHDEGDGPGVLAADAMRAKSGEAAAGDDGEESDSEFRYKPGKGLYLEPRDSKVRMKLRFLVQPMLRFAYISTPTTDTTADWIIRRARMGFDTELPHGVRVKLELQVKNMHLGLSNIYGTWSPNENTEIYVGLIKPPGGLERDSYSFDEPFIERSVLALLTHDHEMGVKVNGTFAGGHSFYSAAVTRDAPAGTDGGDPEDIIQPKNLPPGVDPDDLNKGAGNWNVAGEIGYAPSEHLAFGVTGGTRVRPDGDLGDRVAEPYDTTIALEHPWTGVMVHGDASVAVSLDHFRLMAEGGYRRDGEATDTDTHTHQSEKVGYVTFGFTPGGRYGAAVKNAPLREGWEIITRVEGVNIVPPVGTTPPIGWVGVTSGVNYLVSKQLRVQADLGWQNFGKYAAGENAGVQRVFGQLWMTFRL